VENARNTLLVAPAEVGVKSRVWEIEVVVVGGGRAITQAGACLGPKTRNRAAGAQLRVRHWKWLRGTMEGGGGVVFTR
jgi:hypothetical protein